MKLKKIFYFCLFFLLLTPVVLAVNSFDNKLVYRDISKFDKHFPSVYYFTQENVVKGYPDGHFGVDELVNRAEALKMILLASKIDLEYTSSATEEARYQDVDNEAWYAPFVWKSTKLGIIQGYQDSTFRPGNPVNMAEALKMTFYANGLDNLPVPKKAFIKDVSLDQWFSQETYYAVKNDILWPYTDYTIKPDRYLTRGELLDILYHFVLQDYKNDIAYSGKATYYSDSFQGDHTSSGEEFDQNLLTCAHKFLDFGTMLTVVNIETGATVEVRVNDRGPFTDNLDLDLSKSAFEALGNLSTGVLKVYYFISQ